MKEGTSVVCVHMCILYICIYTNTAHTGMQLAVDSIAS